MAEKRRSKRFAVLESRPVHRDGFIAEWVDVGLVAMASPNDPKPSIRISGGRVVEMDGRRREGFDMIDQFIADYAIDTSNPVMLACDAAEAALRGFAEIETTVAVNRYAPLNALSLLIGSQVGRPGVLTQDALEESFELQIGMKGFTAYAETVSV